MVNAIFATVRLFFGEVQKQIQKRYKKKIIDLVIEINIKSINHYQFLPFVFFWGGVVQQFH